MHETQQIGSMLLTIKEMMQRFVDREKAAIAQYVARI